MAQRILHFPQGLVVLSMLFIDDLVSFVIISARSSEQRSQPPPLSADEAHSDDSDDIVIVSPLLQMKKNYAHF